MKTVYSPNAPEPIGPYSQGKQVDSMLFCSGQIAINPSTGALTGNLAEQTHQVCKNIRSVLAAAGMSFDDVIKTTCYLTEGEDFATFNGIYAQYFTSEPARSCVFAASLPKQALVEVEVIAYKPA